MKEIWKPIQGYENNYEISNFGQVRNKITGKILIGDHNNLGYRRVTLYTPKKQRYFVHRLVALHFCEGYKKDLVVNHKDGNKQNNYCDNLEWVTRSENDLHAYSLELRKPSPCTFKHKILAFNKDTGVLEKEYENVEACAKDLKVARPNIYNCCNGKQKTCKGYILKYKDN